MNRKSFLTEKIFVCRQIIVDNTALVRRKRGHFEISKQTNHLKVCDKKKMSMIIKITRQIEKFNVTLD